MKIAEKFEELREKNESALIAYICAGDPDSQVTRSAVKTLVEGGADIVELGLPFSDPIADGPTIQEASDRAIRKGMNPDKYFELVKSLSVNVPLICMTYYNIIHKYGIRYFVDSCIEARISGIIVPDLPIEESTELKKCCENNNIDLIHLISPITNDERLKKILNNSSGFLYLISQTGVTGSDSNIDSGLESLIKKIKKYTDTPVAVGFGISNLSQVRNIISYGADGVIAGSVFVKTIASGKNMEHELLQIAKELKMGTRHD